MILRPKSAPVDAVLEWLDGLGVNTAEVGRATIDNFDDSHATLAPSATRRFVEDAVAASRHDRVRGLFLVGPTGTGKTHLAVAAMREYHERRTGATVIYDSADRLVTRVQDTYSTGHTDDFIERRRLADLYVLDDLGREKSTTNALQTLCTILDERAGRPTIVTANDLPEQLGVRFPADQRAMWARVDSRLGERVYRFVGVDGPDRRQTAA